MLASEPTCDKAAAALCVGVGKLQEPKGVPGLAHFCEHMLFLGTESFPDETEYKRFVKQNGGKCNASTSDALTCFQFDIMPSHLVGALDRFSQFFVAPLFTASATDREVNAVDSEHSMRITDDSRRSMATLLVDANPKHPWHWGSGNAKSLRGGAAVRGTDLHTEVVQFYRNHYSAAHMTLTVLGRESLEELRQMVEARFQTVRNTGHSVLYGDELGGEELAVQRRDFVGQVLRVPSKDTRSVEFSWQLPEWQVPLWRSKPCSYASHLIGHEGEGSLLSALKARGWALGLVAGPDGFGCFTHFHIKISLTEEGLSHVEEIGSLVFSCLRLLKTTPIQLWVLDEIHFLGEARFRFSDDTSPYSLVTSMSKRMQHYPSEFVLEAGAGLPEPDAAACSRILSFFTVEDLRVCITAKAFDEQCTSCDPWYDGKYVKMPLEEKWKKSWAAASGNSPAVIVRFPSPNPFVPTDLELRPLALQPRRAPQQLSPCLRGDVPALMCFHKQDDRFLLPKSILAVRFHCSSVDADTASYLRALMWCSCVLEELNEFAYDAKIAGLAYHVHGVAGGIELNVSGFSEKHIVLLQAVVEKMRTSSSIPEHVYTLVRDRYERGLKNAMLKQRPCDYARNRVRQLLFSLSHSAEDQLEALGTLSRSSFDGENDRLFRSCHVEALMTGNVIAEDVEAAMTVVQEGLGLNNTLQYLPIRAEAALPAGCTLWRLRGTNVEERNGCTLLRVQLPYTREMSAMCALLVRILNPNFFAELRTRQQLGYIVQTTSSVNEGFVSVDVWVQSEYSPDRVRACMQACWDAQIQLIAELEEVDFALHREGLAANVAETPKNLMEEFSTFWAEITKRTYDFYWKEALVTVIRAITLDSFRSFVDQIQTAPRLWVEVKSVAPGPGKSLLDAPVPPQPDRTWEGPEAMCQFRANARWVGLDSYVPAKLPSQL